MNKLGIGLRNKRAANPVKRRNKKILTRIGVLTAIGLAAGLWAVSISEITSLIDSEAVVAAEDDDCSKYIK